MQRTRDVGDIILSGAKHHLRPVAIGEPPQPAQELIAVHLRHVPVEQHGFWHLRAADFERLLAVLSLDDLKLQPFEDAPGHFADDARVINDQTGLHLEPHFPRVTRTQLDPTTKPSRSVHAAAARAPISSTRSTSSTTKSFPWSRCTPADTR